MFFSIAILTVDTKLFANQTSILPSYEGVPGNTGGVYMKTITIQLPDVESAMLVQVENTNRFYKNPPDLLLEQSRKEYQRYLW